MAAATVRANTPVAHPAMEPTLSLAQRQALIDNLQLEITERARKLRAQYALHAQGLRSRLEMRINRIPQSLRSTNILDLVEKCVSQAEAPALIASIATASERFAGAKSKQSVQSVSQIGSHVPRPRGHKRSSDEMLIASDKENMSMQDELALPKKRSKVPASSQGAARGTSRKVNPAQVLSPKSHNSRTLPRSPIKGQPASGLSSPPKSSIARATSPLKPGATVSAATAALAGLVDTKASSASNSRPNTASSASSAGSLRGNRVGVKSRADMPPPPVPAKGTRNRAASNSSSTSNTSSGTTVVNKKGPLKATAARKGIAGKVAGVIGTAGALQKSTNPAGKKAVATAATGTGGRALRSRK